jgi:SsrA-binding protein
MSAEQDNAFRRLVSNRKALRDYSVIDRLEAGIALHGTEVKSLRAGEASLLGAYACVDGEQIWLHGFNIPPYEHGNRFNHEPTRPRRLLLHRREIHRLKGQTEQKGYSLIPLSVYLKRGLVKVDLGTCKGKTVGDKRETLRRKTAEREAERDMASARRR